MTERICRKCGSRYPLDHRHFGHTPSGGYRYTCRKCMAAHTAAHYAKDPEKLRRRLQKRQRLQRHAGGLAGITVHELMEHWRRQQADRCFYCHTPLNGGGELDHKTPISRGGSDFPENTVLACRQCNRDKHNKTLEGYRVWRRKRGLPAEF